jgi:hypothetical protein
MAFPWINKRVLITIRTYPIPAKTGIEVSCTAGITDEGQWIRLFPLPYRFLQRDQRFKKYQWIDVSVMKATSDIRPESYKLNIDTIKVGDTVSTANQWHARKMLVLPHKSSSLCELEREQQKKGFPTLGIFKPNKINQFSIIPTDSQWTPKQQNFLRQELLFSNKELHPALEKIPYDFKYRFHCADNECRGHYMSCIDWEIGESYRNWSRKYGSDWESKFRQRYEEEMINKYDTYFYVGTVHRHPGSWIIIGLFYPPLASMLSFYNGH